MSSQKLNYRQARWALYLSKFDFTLKYVPGKSIGKADRLNRRPDWQKGVENNNKDKVLIKSEQIRREKQQVEETQMEEESLRGRIRKVQEKDEKVVKVVLQLGISRMNLRHHRLVLY